MQKDENNESNNENQNDLYQLPEEFKNEEEANKFLEELNQKGENATPEENEKRIKCVEAMFSKICKGGNNSKDTLPKLADILGKMNEKERNELLTKLTKDFPKNGKSYKKLIKLIQNKSNKSTNKNTNKISKKNSNKHTFKPKGKTVEKLNLFAEENNSLLKRRKNRFGLKRENEELAKSVRHSDKIDKFRKSKGISESKERHRSTMRLHESDYVEVKDINPLKFDGLFLEITKYTNKNNEKNPFEGPSPYCKFYKDRKIKIKQKITHMAVAEDEDDKEELEQDNNNKQI